LPAMVFGARECITSLQAAVCTSPWACCMLVASVALSNGVKPGVGAAAAAAAAAANVVAHVSRRRGGLFADIHSPASAVCHCHCCVSLALQAWAWRFALESTDSFDANIAWGEREGGRPGGSTHARRRVHHGALTPVHCVFEAPALCCTFFLAALLTPTAVIERLRSRATTREQAIHYVQALGNLRWA
jgi:hypothetical protein